MKYIVINEVSGQLFHAGNAGDVIRRIVEFRGRVVVYEATSLQKPAVKFEQCIKDVLSRYIEIQVQLDDDLRDIYKHYVKELVDDTSDV